MKRNPKEKQPQKIINDIDTKEFTFQEEVTEQEEYDSFKNNTYMYAPKKVRYGFTVLILLSVILFLVSLFSIIFGSVYLNRINNEKHPVVNKYNLIVSHSNHEYGAFIDSFAFHNTEKKAYKYNFSVSNSNRIDLNYRINVINNDYSFDKMDMSLINYSLIKNDIVIKRGTLRNEQTNSICKVIIGSNSLDNYLIEFWSTDIDASKSFSFKINIGI